jgi:hypothetical protein
VSHRAAIFALRAQTDPATGKLYSFGKIADTLGVSKSLVAKELHRTSNDPGADGAGGDDGLGLGLAPAGAGADPDLQLAQRELAQERLALQRMRLRADRLTEERRLQLLENPGQGGNGMMLLLDQQLRQLREEIGRLGQRQAVPAAGAGSLVDQLSQFRQVTETMQAFAPTRPPSSAVELELEAMRQRLQMEDRERMRRLDIDERERMERAAGERARGEAIARLIESSGPLLAQAVQRWADTTPAAGAGAGTVAPGERPMVLPNPAGGTILAPGVIQGACPSCGAQLRLRPEPGQVDRCPRCQQLLAVVNGAIQPKLPPEGGLNYAS